MLKLPEYPDMEEYQRLKNSIHGSETRNLYNTWNESQQAALKAIVEWMEDLPINRCKDLTVSYTQIHPKELSELKNLIK
jgi:hypothetical protein